jgi:hypothetical protein
MLFFLKFHYFLVKLLKIYLSIKETLKSTIINESTKNTEALFFGGCNLFTDFFAFCREFWNLTPAKSEG